MKITSNLGSHSRVIARPGVIARGRIGLNHSRAIARPGVIARGRIGLNHSRAVAGRGMISPQPFARRRLAVCVTAGLPRRARGDGR